MLRDRPRKRAAGHGGKAGPKLPVEARRMLIVLGQVQPLKWLVLVKIDLLGKAFATYAFFL